MYYRDILWIYREMKPNEILRIGFNSGKTIIAYQSDKISVINKDIKIERKIGNNRCITIIEPSLVETVSVITDFENVEVKE